MSTAIGKNLAKQLTRDMDSLLGRGRMAFPCPLNQHERKQFWHNTFPPYIVAAHELLKQNEYVTTGNTSQTASIKVDELLIIFQSEEDDLLQHPAFRWGVHPVDAHAWRCAFPFDEERWQQFISWRDNCAQIDKEFEAALKAFKELLEFCGTVGQLTRAVPELRTHLPGKSQDALKDQVRASNMPFEWAKFDRERVRNLQMAMCKAFLLPSRICTWTGYNGTWAKDYLGEQA
jgi:hypothetical protein